MFNSYSPVQNMIFVTEDEAIKYIIPPSSKVLLMSKDTQKFWVKSSDSWGQTTLESYSFTKDAPTPQITQSTADFVTKQDFEAFKNDILSALKTTQSNSQEVTANVQSTQPTTTTW